jgi:hydroxyethylthiazole kinase-like uncharacterized protein yjeF
MQDIESRAFAQGVEAADLMEQAGLGIANAIRQFFPQPGTAILYLGKGNNAGDALVAARHLATHGWTLWARLSASPIDFKPLPRIHWQALGSKLRSIPQALTPEALPPAPLLLLDGLLGIGASGPLQPVLSELALEMNRLRQQAHASTVAMDLPSGLDGDSGHPSFDAVCADLTCTVAQVKSGLVADSAINHVGRLCLIPLPALQATEGDATATLATPSQLRPLLPRRAFDTHKGQAGRVSIIAGSPGYLGAAELACRGALQAGAGMVTLWVPPAAYQLLAIRVPAEVMVRRSRDFSECLDHPHDALVIGPGLGRKQDEPILNLLSQATAATVVDADALNALAAQRDWPAPAGPRLLTPHPGEWARLAPDLACSGMSRRAQAERFVAHHPATTLLLKGARTVIAHAGQATFFNSTGHPGMATGGMGDVLSGVLGALVASGMTTFQAAAVGAWLCGRAAERTALASHENATLPSTTAAALGGALQDLVQASY